MTGIRKRVTIGFLSIVVLLFFSGLVSLFELNHMSQDIDAILSSNRQGIALSESMLDAIRANDRAVIRYAVLRDTTYADSCKVSASIFAQTITSAREKITSSDNASLFDSLDVAAQRLSSLVEQLHASGRVEQSVRIDDFWGVVPTFNGSEWYNKEFLTLYNNASGHILQVLTYAQNSLTPRAERLSSNAYRAVTPVFISLVVMIVILLMFYYFIMIYAIKPIVQMNKSLGDWLRYRLPFTIKAECRDEIADLRDKIESITTNTKTTTK